MFSFYLLASVLVFVVTVQFVTSFRVQRPATLTTMIFGSRFSHSNHRHDRGSHFQQQQQGGELSAISSLRNRFSKMIKVDPLNTIPVDSMPFSTAIKDTLKGKGFINMTAIQSQSYDIVFAGHDVVARSRTGTGKTFAFGIPLIEKLTTTRR